eukprot:6195120-Pleurochrysis_carterae.AAC.1
MLRKTHLRKASLSGSPAGMAKRSRVSSALGGCISNGTRLLPSLGASNIAGSTAVARVRQG